MKNFDTTLYFITDSTGFSEEEFLSRVEQALKGGVTLLQLREKEKTTREYIALAEKVHKLTQKYNIPLIIDDRIDVAMAVNAEGVHLGQSDMPVDIARKILGEDKIIGATAKTVPQALEAYANGADNLGVGAIYPTTTKVKTVLTSVDTLKEIGAWIQDHPEEAADRRQMPSPRPEEWKPLLPTDRSVPACQQDSLPNRTTARAANS
mgnify:CR=1 FL=1